MEWKSLDLICKNFPLPQNYRVVQMQKSEIDHFIANLEQWYPDIRVGSESRFLKHNFYLKEIFRFEEDISENRFFPILLKAHPNEEIAGWAFLEKNDDALSITSPMGGIAPHYRRMGLALIPPLLIEVMGKAIGAEFAYTVMTLRNVATQKVMEKLGFQLVGILPAHDRDLIGPGNIKRVYEAIYAKVLVDEKSVFYPSKKSLTPKTQELWNFLFKKELKDE